MRAIWFSLFFLISSVSQIIYSEAIHLPLASGVNQELWPEDAQLLARYEFLQKSDTYYIVLEHLGLADLEGLDLTVLDFNQRSCSYKLLSADTSEIHLMIDGRSGPGTYSVYFADFQKPYRSDPRKPGQIVEGERKGWKPQLAYVLGEVVNPEKMKNMKESIHTLKLKSPYIWNGDFDKTKTIQSDTLIMQGDKSHALKQYSFMIHVKTKLQYTLQAEAGARLLIYLDDELFINRLFAYRNLNALISSLPLGNHRCKVVLIGDVRFQITGDNNFIYPDITDADCQLMRKQELTLLDLLEKKVNILKEKGEEHQALNILTSLQDVFVVGENNRFQKLFLEVERLAHANHWPMLSQDPQRNGSFKFSGKSFNLFLSGKTDTFLSNPEKTVFSTGRVIDGEYVFAFDDEQLLRLIRANITSGVVQQGSLCFFATDDHRAHAIDVSLKKKKWTIELPGRIIGDPLVYSGYVYFASDRGKLVAVNIASGEIIWQLSLAGPVHGSQALDKGVIVVGDTEGNLHGVHWQDGRTLWVNRLSGGIVGTPCIVNKKVYIGTQSGVLSSLSLHTGEIVWQKKMSGPLKGGLCYIPYLKMLVTGTSNGNLHLIHVGGSEFLYSPIHLEGAVQTPISGREFIYVASKTKFFQIDGFTGKILNEFSAPRGEFTRAPVFDGQRIRVNTVTRNGALITGGSSYAFSFEELPPKYKLHVKPSVKELSIDGQLNEDAWKNAEVFASKIMSHSAPHKRVLESRYVWSQKYLYFSGVVEDEEVLNEYEDLNYQMTTSDVLEFMFDFGMEDVGHFQLNIKPNGEIHDFYRTYATSKRSTSVHEWDGRIELKTSIWEKEGKKGWQVEGRIAWERFAPLRKIRGKKGVRGTVKLVFHDGVPMTKNGGRMRFNFVSFPFEYTSGHARGQTHPFELVVK